jgi:hypothetical protein
LLNGQSVRCRHGKDYSGFRSTCSRERSLKR